MLLHFNPDLMKEAMDLIRKGYSDEAKCAGLLIEQINSADNPDTTDARILDAEILRKYPICAAFDNISAEQRKKLQPLMRDKLGIMFTFLLNSGKISSLEQFCTDKIKAPVIIVKVNCLEPYSVCGKSRTITMIPFSGKACGGYFNGRIIGNGIDTQNIFQNGKTFLSARYMLEGTDFNLKRCRVFIENNGDDMNNCKPSVVTDSEALSFLEDKPLNATVEPTDSGINIKIYLS